MKNPSLEIYNRIKNLREKIEYHSRLYYIENNPEISDFEFDLLMQDLIELEKRNPLFFSSDSPTQKVGNDLLAGNINKEEFVSHKHLFPMLSLSNSYSIEEVSQFIEKTKSLSPYPKYFCELKYDGAAISITYKNGKLDKAVTRGDGEQGDVVTDNVLTIKSIPKYLEGEGFPNFFEIRGEIFMPFSVFDQLNIQRDESNETRFANPRNAASGSLKLLDSVEVAKRNLSCVLYHIVSNEKIADKHSEILEKAYTWGLPISSYSKLCNSLDDITDYISTWNIKRKELPFATDGIVIKVDNISYQNTLGYTSKFPRWAIAYKFKAEQALTKLVSIDFQVGRTGAITPVANLEPVQLSGSVVKRASLHNLDQIKLLDIHYGDMLYVEKGGEIIPKITGVEYSMRIKDSKSVEFPSKCPDCSTLLVREEDESRHYCPNSNKCPTQIKGKILHFCSRKAMDILAGEATIDQLFDKKLVENFSDLYFLTPENLLNLDGWQIKSAQRFIATIQKSKERDFQHVLYALGIRHVGESTAKALAYHFKSVDNLISSTKEELLYVDDVGETVANSILFFFSSEENIKIIARLKDIGLKFAVSDNNVALLSTKLINKTIVVTGIFSTSRDNITNLIELHGGKCVSSISKSTDILITGSEAGASKLEKARKLGTTVLDEDELMELLKG